jgi:hypothetical protein
MITWKRLGILVLTAALAISLEYSGRQLIPAMTGFISTAQAYVNRQMSPVDVTHVAQTGLWGGCDAALMTTC